MKIVRFRIAILALLASPIFAGEILLQIPPGMKIVSSVAVARNDSVTGTRNDNEIRFSRLQAGVRYDISLETLDGQIEQGVDSGWYNDEKADPDAGEMDDDLAGEPHHPREQP